MRPSGSLEQHEHVQPPIAGQPFPLGAVVTTAPLGLRAHLSRSRMTALVITLALFSIFLPVLINLYGFSDDYLILSMADHLLASSPWIGKDLLQAGAVNGRPITGLFLGLAYPAAGTIGHLALIRLVGVLGIAALALVLHWVLVRSGISVRAAALIAVLVCGLPSFEVYASWTTLFTAPYVAILAGCASLIAVAAVDAPRHLVADRALGATAALTAALLTYQPAAMYFWVFLAVALIGAVGEPRRALRILRMHFGVAFVSLGLAYLVVKAGSDWAGKGAPNAARNTLVTDVAAKARWFVEVALYQALNLTNLTPVLWLAVAVAGLALVGVPLLLLNRRTPYPPLWVGTGLVLIPLCYIPNLVVRESAAFYRTQAAITSLVALYACLGAIGIWLSIRDWLRPRVADRALATLERVALVVPVALVCVSTFVAARNVSTLFVGPQATELRLMRSQIAALPDGVARVGFVETAWSQGMTKVQRYDEFGLPSSGQPWVPQSAVLLILREEGRLVPGRPPIVDVYPPGTGALPDGEPEIDLHSQLLDLR